MSAAAAEHAIIAPQIKQRSWATVAIVSMDVIALELALLLACLVRLGFRELVPIDLGPPQYMGLAAGVLIVPLAYYLAELYPGYGVGAVQRLRARTYATLFVFAALLVWNYIFEDRHWSRGVLLLTGIFALIAPPLLEALLRKSLIARGVCGQPVIVLGAGRTGALVVKTLQREFDLGFVPVGILDDDARKWGTAIDGVPVLGPLSRIAAFEDRAKVVLIAIPSMNRERLSTLVQNLSFSNIIIVPDLFGIQSLWIASRDLGGVIGLEVRKNLLVGSNRLLKRALDLAIAIPLFVASAPLIALSAAAIKLIHGGPVFFRQQREGQNGNQIRIVKLRTMYPNAERLLADYLESHPDEKRSWSQYYKLKTDPRILPGIGWFLRRYSLDELPQLWNVLRGDMSLVGPRPLPYYHLDSFPETFRGLRSSVMPGLTGLWQVSARSDGDLKVHQAEDTYYIRNWSIWLDVYILLRSVQPLLLPKGAY